MTAAKQRPPRWTEYVALDEIVRAPRNPKNHNADLIANSMARFGVVELPTVDERTGRLVAGHGRLDDWTARRDNGDDPPEGVTTDEAGNWMVPVNRGWSSRSDQDAEAYLIVSNQSTIAGGWDEPELHGMLQQLKEADLLDFTGFTDDDVTDMARRHGGTPDLDEFADSLGEQDHTAGWPTISLKVPHHVSSAWEGVVAEHGDNPAHALAALLGVDPDPPAWEPDLTRQQGAEPAGPGDDDL